MKRLISLLLVFCMLLPLCACGETPAPAQPESAPAPTEPTPAEPAEPTPTEPEPEPAEPQLWEIPIKDLDPELVEQALVAVGMAFYYKNPDIQYESQTLTIEPKLVGAEQRTTGQSPEDSAWDTMHHSQCSEYCWDVYYEAMRFDYLGDRKGYESRIYEDKWIGATVTGLDSKMDLNDREEALRILREESRPGDIILGYGDSGHVLLLVGDVDGDGKQDVMHCWPYKGGKLDLTTGVQKIEPGGSILIQPVEDVLLSSNGSPSWNISNDSHGKRWYLFRPTLLDECKECTLTPATVSRLNYPLIDIDKYAQYSRFDDIQEGEDIIITQTVTNHSTQDYADLKIEEYIPEGAEFVSADKTCTVDGATLRWTLNVPAGQSVTTTYTVRNLKKQGETLTIPAGLVDMIPSRTMDFRVGGKKFTDSQLAALNAIAEGLIPAALTPAEFADLDILNVFYREILGAEIGLPATIADYISLKFKTTKPLGVDTKMLTAKELPADRQYLDTMVLPSGMNGYYMTTGTDISGRAMQVLDKFYQPGDLFFTMKSPNTSSAVSNTGFYYYVYLGGGKVLEYSVKGTSIRNFADTVGVCLIDSLFVALRPRLAYADLSKEVEAPKAAAEEVSDAVQLLDLAAQSEASGTVRITEDITMPGSFSLSGKDLVIAAGKTLDVGAYTLTVKSFTLEDGAKIVNAEAGRIAVVAKDEAATTELLKKYDGQAVSVVCAYDDTNINNNYDCMNRVVLFKPATASVGTVNLTSLLNVLPAGWTMKMGTGFVSSGVQNFKVDDFTIDVNGYTLGQPSFEGKPIKVINSRPGKGGLCFRGATDGKDIELTNTIDAAGQLVTVGYEASSSHNSATLTVTGSLTYGTLVLNNGSTATGNLTEAK